MAKDLFTCGLCSSCTKIPGIRLWNTSSVALKSCGYFSLRSYAVCSLPKASSSSLCLSFKRKQKLSSFHGVGGLHLPQLFLPRYKHLFCMGTGCWFMPRKIHEVREEHVATERSFADKVEARIFEYRDSPEFSFHFSQFSKNYWNNEKSENW